VKSELECRHRFEDLVGEVFDPLQRYLGRRVSVDDAADLLSETLMTIWRRLDDIPKESVLPWCYGVARRVLANHHRGRRRHLRLVARLESQRSPVAADPSDGFDDLDLADALGTLPEPDQEVLRLWAWEQLEPREIALALDTTANAVSLRLSRAKKKLAAALPRQDASTSGHKRDRHAEEKSND